MEIQDQGDTVLGIAIKNMPCIILTSRVKILLARDVANG